MLKPLLELTKPRITLMVVLTTAAGFVLGAWALGSGISARRLLAALLGTGLLAAGASALNMWWEREIDSAMRRTSRRPLPDQRLNAAVALSWGLFLGSAGCALLWVETTVAAAMTGLATLLLYVLVYTQLKRVAWWNTLVGAVPGALPTLVGWLAANPSVDAVGWLFFAFLLIWQLPHFFAIDWIHREDYARGNLRMLSAEDLTGKRSGQWTLFTTVVLLAVSLALALVAGAKISFAVALVLGAIFLYFSLRFAKAPNPQTARSVLLWSVCYLPLVMTILVIDRAFSIA